MGTNRSHGRRLLRPEIRSRRLRSNQTLDRHHPAQPHRSYDFDKDDEDGEDAGNEADTEAPTAIDAEADTAANITSSAALQTTAVQTTPHATSPPSAAATGDTSRGYQWKQLFLPNGTELRTIYCGHSLYATVENEQIIIDGTPTTPSRLTNRQGCGSRNAWKTIWLHFPGAKRWKLAARCRDEPC